MTNAPAASIVALASGQGTTVAALVAACADPAYGASVVAVVSDRADAAVLDIAAEHGIATAVVAPGDFPDRATWDEALARTIATFSPDLVALLGFMRIVGEPVLERFEGRILNTHPSLLPAYPGAHAVADALADGATQTGCTVMLIDAGVDTGPILAQRTLEVRDNETEDALHARIKEIEQPLVVETIGTMLRHGWSIEGREVTLFRKDDHMAERRPIRRALVSVYDKTGIEELAAALSAAGVEIVSTGSTAKRIADSGVAVTPVESVTEFPECLDGRVKTLHPRIHAGLLADLRNPDHAAQLEELGVAPFDLVIVNLYPFVETVASGAEQDAVIEQIDIGGPSMVRAAAKNHPSVAVVVDPAGYGAVADAVAAGGFTLAERQGLAAEAFRHTAAYDIQVASWMGSVVAPDADDAGFPGWVGASYERVQSLRYGENPHQGAALYRTQAGADGLAAAVQHHGKEMSYNNYVDADAALRAAFDHERPAIAIIKHANPCGVAVGSTIAEAYAKALETDPVSAFGSVVAANRPVSVEAATLIAKIFTEVVIAPGYEDGAIEILSAKKNLRVLEVSPERSATESRPISGGLLVQARDNVDAPGDDVSTWEVVAGPAPDEATLADLDFAWRACRSVKSNAILLASEGAAVGIGMGQVNRVDSCKLAVARATEERARGAVAASDAFFPFADGLMVLAQAGVKAIVSPGGSVRDAEVIEAANQAGVTLVHTGTRHFFH